MFALWMEAITPTMINHFFWIIRQFIYKKETRTYELTDTVVCSTPTEEKVYSRRATPKKRKKIKLINWGLFVCFFLQIYLQLSWRSQIAAL